MLGTFLRRHPVFSSGIPLTLKAALRSSSAVATHTHYHRAGLTDTIITALQRGGKDITSLTPADLAPVDQFHTRGKPATIELAKEAKLSKKDTVLDIGCAVGGPARTLAEFGCTVVGIDVMEEYIKAAQRLTSLVKLDNRVSFRVGDALALPFEKESFDVVWSQHVSMNIADKETFYKEVFRVLKPHGRFAFSDICSVPKAPSPVYPVPWSRMADTSHLVSAADKLSVLQKVGFQKTSWHERSTEAEQALKKVVSYAEENASKPAPPLGLHLLLGPDAQTMVRNLYDNIQQKRVTVVDAVMTKPATATNNTEPPATATAPNKS